mgnify:CR=1 FL=1
MTQNTETSVMFALAELQRSEVARQAEEVAREAQRQKEREDKERRERERDAERERTAHGIPLVLPVVEDLRDIAKRTGIPLE